LVDEFEFPIAHISPTHVGRTKSLFDQALLFAKKGGMIDITTGASKYTDPHKSVLYAIEQGVSIDQLTFSSDGNAGLDRLDKEGNFIGVRRASFSENLNEMIALAKTGNIPFGEALKVITSNPAKNLGLRNKGSLKVGFDADLCVFNDDYSLSDVFANGRQMMDKGNVIVKNTVE
jgi:beta-aspartyl-dipeptidase (metallo-type)